MQLRGESTSASSSTSPQIRLLCRKYCISHSSSLHTERQTAARATLCCSQNIKVKYIIHTLHGDIFNIHSTSPPPHCSLVSSWFGCKVFSCSHRQLSRKRLASSLHTDDRITCRAICRQMCKKKKMSVRNPHPVFMKGELALLCVVLPGAIFAIP